MSPSGLAQNAAPALAFSIPLAFGGQFTTVELTVQRDSGGRGEADGAASSVRAHFSVRLDRLGEVGADLRLSGPSLRGRLSAPPGPAHDLLSAAVEELRGRWQQAGFQVDALDCVPAAQDAVETLPPVTLHHVNLAT